MFITDIRKDFYEVVANQVSCLRVADRRVGLANVTLFASVGITECHIIILSSTAKTRFLSESRSPGGVRHRCPLRL